MKTKSIIISTTFICLLPICSLMAECITNENQQEEIATMLKNYTQYATSKDEAAGIYELCFNSATPLGFNDNIKKNLVINVPLNHKLMIKGLNFPDSLDNQNFQSNDSILILSGSNITLDNVVLAGNGSGTAIQVNGTNVVIQNSTISNFTKGIEVMVGGSAKLAKNTYEIFDWKNAILQGTDWIAKYETDATKYKIGKHISEADNTKVDYIVAEVANTVTCGTGSIEMSFADESADNDSIKKYKPLESAVCQQPTGAHDDYSIDTNNDEKEDYKIVNGKCAFKCAFSKQDLKLKTLFTYTTADDKTYSFSPLTLKSFTELGSVISVMGPLSMPSTPSGADTGTIIVTGYTGATETTETTGTGNVKGAIGGPNIDGAGDNSDSGGGSGDGSSNNSGDGGLVNQEAGSNSATGCTIITGATTGPINRATTAIPFIFALLGLMPIGWRRMVRK